MLFKDFIIIICRLGGTLFCFSPFFNESLHIWESHLEKLNEIELDRQERLNEMDLKLSKEKASLDAMEPKNECLDIEGNNKKTYRYLIGSAIVVGLLGVGVHFGYVDVSVFFKLLPQFLRETPDIDDVLTDTESIPGVDSDSEGDPVNSDNSGVRDSQSDPVKTPSVFDRLFNFSW